MASKLVDSICPFCGVGCGVSLSIDGRGRLAGVSPQPNHPVSRGQLCAKGWNIAYGIAPRERVTHPLLRTPKGFQPISWNRALDYIGEALGQVMEASGPDALGIISSARATNEDNYAAQKLARGVFKTNNIDHCARICHSPTVAGLQQTLGSGAMTNSVADLPAADLIMVFGADPTENHSVLGGRIIRAQRQGAKLVVVDPRQTRLAKLADRHLQLQPGTNIALVNAILCEIFSNQWQNGDFLAERCQGVERLLKSVRDCTPAAAAALTGVAADAITATAYDYSHADSAMILYGMGVTQFVSGTNNVIALSNLALCCGHIGRPGTGVNPLRGQNNVQGACDMGCLPNVYPGYQAVASRAVRDKFAAAWQTTVPAQPGLTSLGMTRAASGGELQALILFGEDPVVTDPDQNHVRAALQKLDLLVVAELSLTETAKLADVVLPAASFAEKEGTFTNCERRVQRIHKALEPPGEARADWQWLADIARRLNSSLLDWPDAEAVFGEMARLTPSYSAMNYAALEHQGLQWPCDAAAPEGTAILHRERFPIGRARLLPVHYQPIDEAPDDNYPLLLTTNRLHYHYGCGSMTRRSPLLERETPAGILFMHPQDAARYSLQHLSAVGVRSRRGYVETRVVITTDVPPGVVSMPYHFREAPSNQLTNTAQDPVTRMPELKACAVAVTALPEGSEPRDIDTLLSHGRPTGPRNKATGNAVPPA